jgi:diguanylate cyclase (GGDEF)-like protein
VNGLDRRLAEEFERARRYSLSFSLILLAVDPLGGADVLARPSGEQLMAEIGGRLRRELRIPDYIARSGHDEFAIVLPETGQEGARRSVSRLRDRLTATPFDGGATVERARYSAGIVTYPHPAASQPDDLFALVETALMRGKGQSGERIAVAE